MGLEMQSNNSESPPIYTVAEAARRVGVSYQRFIYAMAKEWVIPFQKEPTQLFTEEELLRYAKEQQIDL